MVNRVLRILKGMLRLKGEIFGFNVLKFFMTNVVVSVSVSWRQIIVEGEEKKKDLFSLTKCSKNMAEVRGQAGDKREGEVKNFHYVTFIIVRVRACVCA